jgi:hypothetical protein
MAEEEPVAVSGPEDPVGSSPEGATPKKADRPPTDPLWVVLGVLAVLVGCGGAAWLILGPSSPLWIGNGAQFQIVSSLAAALAVAVMVLLVVLRQAGKKRRNPKMLGFARGALWTIGVIVTLALLSFGSCVVILTGFGVGN